MDNGNRGAMPGTNGLITGDEVREQMNVVEHLQSLVGDEDDYLQAMLNNQRIMLTMMAQQPAGRSPARDGKSDSMQTDNDGSPTGYPVSSRPVDIGDRISPTDLPLAAVGIASENIDGNDTGVASFQINGTVFAETIRADEPIPSGEPAQIVAPGNVAAPLTDVALSLLGLSGEISPGQFSVEETADNVTVSPGEREVVQRIPVDGGRWIATGTNDETFTEYTYYVDGEPLTDEPLKEPLGLYNDPFRFPVPISASREVRIEVKRLSSAAGDADYYNKSLLIGAE